MRLLLLSSVIALLSLVSWGSEQCGLYRGDLSGFLPDPYTDVISTANSPDDMVVFACARMSNGSTGILHITFGSAGGFNPVYGELPHRCTTVGIYSVSQKIAYTAGNGLILRSGPPGVTKPVAGAMNNYGSSNGRGHSARFGRTLHLVVDTRSSDQLYVADVDNYCIRKVTITAGYPVDVSTSAGECGSSGDTDGSPQVARFVNPANMLMSPTDGSLYIVDLGTMKLRKQTTSTTTPGVVTTVGSLSNTLPLPFTFFKSSSGIILAGGSSPPCSIFTISSDTALVKSYAVAASSQCANPLLGYGWSGSSVLYGVVGRKRPLVRYSSCATPEPDNWDYDTPIPTANRSRHAEDKDGEDGTTMVYVVVGVVIAVVLVVAVIAAIAITASKNDMGDSGQTTQGGAATGGGAGDPRHLGNTMQSLARQQGHPVSAMKQQPKQQPVSKAEKYVVESSDHSSPPVPAPGSDSVSVPIDSAEKKGRPIHVKRKSGRTTIKNHDPTKKDSLPLDQSRDTFGLPKKPSKEGHFMFPTIEDSNESEVEHAKRRRLVDDGRFKVLQRVGRGTHGLTYACMLEDGSFLALKETELHAGEEEVVELMAKEVNRAKHWLHPNVMKYYGMKHKEYDMKVQLFTEYAANGTLDSFAKNNESKIPERICRRYARQIVAGLNFLHMKGVVHRDLKPANICLTQEGICKLSDFSACTVVGTTTGKASRRAQTMIGTPIYMAPEIILLGIVDEGEEAGYGKKADVWSLGITLIELMNGGKPPWPEFANEVAAFRHIAQDDVLPVFPDHITGDCLDFVRQCCRRNPDERPKTSELMKHPWLGFDA